MFLQVAKTSQVAIDVLLGSHPFVERETEVPREMRGVCEYDILLVATGYFINF